MMRKFTNLLDFLLSVALIIGVIFLLIDWDGFFESYVVILLVKIWITLEKVEERSEAVANERKGTRRPL